MVSNTSESGVSRLCFGKVSKYFGDKGYGFINQIYPDNQSTRDIFFHIKKVKHLNIDDSLNDLDDNMLSSNEVKDIYFWYVPEITDKGVAVLKCWLDVERIDVDYLFDFMRSFYKEAVESRRSDDIKTKLCNNSKSDNDNQRADMPEEYYSSLLLDADKEYYSDENIDYSYYYIGNISNEKYFDIADDLTSFKSYTHALPPLEFKSKYSLTDSEIAEALRWIRIYKINKFCEHFEVNNYITKNNLWDEFKHIRSLNDHQEHKNIPGIKPKIYHALCIEFNISGNKGRPLTACREY